MAKQQPSTPIELEIDKSEAKAKNTKPEVKAASTAGKKASEVQELREELRKLRNLVIEMGTHTGQANIIRMHGYKSFAYVKKDKYENRS